MKLGDLKRIHPPKPRQPKICVACKAFRAECEVPIGEGSAPMCWNCAHHVVDHDVPLHEAMTAECECTPDKVYPDRSMLVGTTCGNHVPSYEEPRLLTPEEVKDRERPYHSRMQIRDVPIYNTTYASRSRRN